MKHGAGDDAKDTLAVQPTQFEPPITMGEEQKNATLNTIYGTGQTANLSKPSSKAHMQTVTVRKSSMANDSPAVGQRRKNNNGVGAYN
jgi:hypothetical protein